MLKDFYSNSINRLSLVCILLILVNLQQTRDTLLRDIQKVTRVNYRLAKSNSKRFDGITEQQKLRKWAMLQMNMTNNSFSGFCVEIL